MALLSRAVPALWLIAATLVAALPWRLGADARLLPPLAVAAVVVLATVRRGAALPVWLVLACGIAYDSLTQAPIGFFALLWLAALGIAQLLHPMASGLSGRLATGTVAMGAVGALGWSLASLYELQRQPLAPHTWSTAAAILLALLLTSTIEAWTAARPARSGGLNLERGR